MDGASGNDTLYGGEGEDYLIGGSDNNVFYGGADADVFECSGRADFIQDFELNLDSIDRAGFENASYQISSSSDSLWITAPHGRLTIWFEDITTVFRPYESGEDAAAWAAQFDILWA